MRQRLNGFGNHVAIKYQSGSLVTDSESTQVARIGTLGFLGRGGCAAPACASLPLHMRLGHRQHGVTARSPALP